MNKAIFTPEENGMALRVERSFSAPRARVWQAWTTQDMLEKWWAPAPYQAKTVSFDFREGGHWHYYMLGPDNSKSYCWASYDTVTPEAGFTGDDYFCDEKGERNTTLPRMRWQTEFQDEGEGTKVIVTVSFDSREDLEKITAMGFKEGFSMGLDQLEKILVQ